MQIPKIILTIIQKNFRIILRSRTSALVILVGPLLLIAIVGTAFNSSELSNIRLGYFAEKRTEPVENIIRQIRLSSFDMMEFNSKDECVDKVRNAKIHVCMAFADDFDFDNLNSSKNIEFYVDFSRMNLAWIIWDEIKGRIGKESSEVSLRSTEQLIEKLKKTADELDQNKEHLVRLVSDGKKMNVQITDIKDDIDTIDLNFSLDEIDIGEYEKATEEGKQDLAQVKDDIQEIKSDMEDVSRQYNESISSVEALQEDISHYINLTQEERQKTLLEYDLDCNNTPLDDECSELNDKLSSLDSVLSFLELMEQDISSKKREVDQEDFINNVNAKVDEADSAVDSYREKLDMMSEGLIDLKQIINDSKAKLNSMEEKKNQTSNQISLMSEELSQNLDQVDSLIAKVDQLNSELSDITITNAETLIKPISTQMKSISKQKKFINYMLPGFFMVGIMFIGILLGSTTVLSEKESKAHFRNFLAPVPDTFFVLGLYISNLIIVLVQNLVLLMIAFFYFKISLSSFGSIMTIFFMSSTVFVLMGMFIGYFFNTEETATIGSICTCMILLMFSSLYIPIESMSKEIGKIAVYNPFVVADTILRKAILFNKGIGDSLGSLLIMALYVVILAAPVIYLYHKSKKRLS